MADKMYVGDIGTEFIVDCGSDLTGATTTDLRVKKPDGTVETWAAAIYNTNYLKYTIVSGDLDQEGEYELQSYVVLPSWTGRGETVEFTVYSLFG